MTGWAPVGLAAVLPILLIAALGLGEPRGAGPLTLASRRVAAAVSVERWAGGYLLFALPGFVIAGIGLRWDLAWHAAQGRDAAISPPHMFAELGTLYVALAIAAGIWVATSDGVPGLRVGHLSVPRTLAVSSIILSFALVGFGLDEAWHRAFGSDSAMWTPTHLLMLLGGSTLVVLVGPLLNDARLRPWSQPQRLLIGTVVGTLLLGSFSMLQGEYNMGGPFFPQIYHPLLVCVSAAFVFTTLRVSLGFGTPIAAALLLATLNHTGILPSFGLSHTREALYLGSALAIDFFVRPSRSGRRIAITSTLCIVLVGLPIEVLWSRGWRQPWSTDMVIHSLPYVFVGSLAASLLASRFARATSGGEDRAGPAVPRWAVASFVMAAAFIVPAGVTRPHVDIAARLPTQPGSPIEVEVHPRSAADGAWWFQVVGYGGGGVFASDLIEDPGRPGTFVTQQDVQLGAEWKVAIRLHRGSVMLLMPLDERSATSAVQASTARQEARDPVTHVSGPMFSERDPAVRERIGLGATGPLALGFAALGLVLAAWMRLTAHLLVPLADAKTHGIRASRTRTHRRRTGQIPAWPASLSPTEAE